MSDQAGIAAVSDAPTRREPSKDRYDVVVVGSGLGGLTVGALLANAGRSVLVLERSDGPGGCAHAFRRGPYLFDPAIHMTVEVSDGYFLDSLLRHLAVRDRCTFAEAKHLYTAIFPDFRFDAAPGREAFLEAHAAAFPEAEDELRGFFAFRDEVVSQMMRLPLQLGLTDLPLAMARFPLVFKHRSDTFGDVLEKHIRDPRARSVLTAFWPYIGLPPSRLSFFLCAQMLGILMPGSYYSLGSFQKLADAFVTAIDANGGEVVVEAPVRNILVDHGRAHGVVLEGGGEVHADVIVSNADLRSTLEQLVGLRDVPRSYWNKIKRMKPSLSGVVVFASTKRDMRELDVAHETFIFRHWDHEATYRDVLEGRPGGIWMNVPTLLDDSLAPAGEHLVIISALSPYDLGTPWDSRREAAVEAIVQAVDEALPGLASDLQIVESATPETLHRATLSQDGALYGWENSPQQAYNKRPVHATPIDGLYIAGHWAQEGPGSFRSMFSGVEAARQLLGGPEADEIQTIIDSTSGTPAPVKFDKEPARR